ncbi:MAG: hypothetical protein WCP77_14355, partial [Roseococcus sp.]
IPWLALPLLAACGSTPPPAPPPPDETLGRAARAGRLALELDRPAEAARLYGTALGRARERDDAAAIADTGIGLAAADLARSRNAEALRTAREVRAELLRRGAPVPDALLLVEALALFRTGDVTAAQNTAAQIGTEDADIARRAWFLRGLIAAGCGDQAGLAEARAALGEPEGRAFRADARELAAAAALATGDAAGARRLAIEAATLRREGLDYRGLGRALALEAEAAQRLGETTAAADLLLRAGRGAAARNEFTEARRWLTAAETLARQARLPEVASAARSTLRAMAERERDAAG